MFQLDFGHITALKQCKAEITFGERLAYVGLNTVRFHRVPTIFFYITAYRRQTVLWVTNFIVCVFNALATVLWFNNGIST